MIQFICVLKSGGAYDEEDVFQLKMGIDANYRGARFACLSDIDLDCERIALTENLPGWWSKLEMYKPREWGEGIERIVYFDLDTIIKGPIEFFNELLSEDRLYALEDWYHPDKTANSSIVSFRPGQCDHIWEKFSEDPRKYIQIGQRSGMWNWGDQGFLTHHFESNIYLLQPRFPDRIVSYKTSTKAMREKASVVCFHGNPRPRQRGWRWE